jgi:serine phosphatase RsbU (regulator of sigma subunit)
MSRFPTTVHVDQFTNDKWMSPIAHVLTCSEVWGANSNVAHSVELPGLHGWVYSAPLELGQAGGDIHYLSVCDYGILSRIALADVSGHGRAVSALAERLLGLMRRHITTLEQPEFLRELSDSVQNINDAGRLMFATALLIGFDSSTGELVFTNAGHPLPLWYRAGEKRWGWLQEAISDAPRGRVGLPLGLALATSYADTVAKLGPGDLLICYTDGLSEARNGAGGELGANGLLEMARTLPVESPMAAGAMLLGLVDAFRRGNRALDDETLIVLQRLA